MKAKANINAYTETYMSTNSGSEQTEIERKAIARALSVLEIEARAIQELASRIGKTFVSACEKVLACEGRVVVSGMGKSGHIGRKIAATLASTGTPAIFLHPGEASHGDLGMITPKDLLLTLSNSGETDEILLILPLIKRLGVPIVALTGNASSTLSKYADIHLDVSIHEEACPLGLAPTASTTAALAMGDALAITVLEMRGFTVEEFAQSHPSGRLGKRLLLKVSDLMHKDDAIPRVTESAVITDAVLEMTQKKLGFTTIVETNNPSHMLGIFTDGDLRRTIERNLDLQKTPIKQVMTKTCKLIEADTLAHQAIHLMETDPKSFVLPVVDKHGALVGALSMHNLLNSGVV